MNLNNIRKLAKIMAESPNLRSRLMLVGDKANAKTATVEQVARDLKVDRMVSFDVAVQEPGDVIGLQRIVDGVTVHLAPNWWPKENENVLIFLDEFARARPEMVQVLHAFVQTKRIHTHTIPKGAQLHIIAAMNPATDNYLGTNVDDDATMGRFLQVKVHIPKEEAIQYALDNKYRQATIKTLEDHYNTINPAPNFSLNVKGDLRQMEYADMLFRHPDMLDSKWEFQHEAVAGMLGTELATIYMKNLDEEKQESPLKGEDILKEFSKHEAKIVKWKELEDGRRDLLNVSIANLKDFIKNNGDLEIQPEYSTNFNQFLVLIGKDLQITTLMFEDDSMDKNALFEHLIDKCDVLTHDQILMLVK